MGTQPDIVADLYRHSLPRLGAYAFLLTGSYAEAEELVQAAIVKVCARPRRLPDSARAEAYVRATIRTLHIDGLRRRERWARVAPRFAVPDAVDGPGEALAASGRGGHSRSTPWRRACALSSRCITGRTSPLPTSRRLFM